MINNRGTVEGNIQEKLFVKDFNLNKNSNIYSNYISNCCNSNINELFMVRVTTKQFSKLSNQRVMTRADAYMIHSRDKNIFIILAENKNYLDEDLLGSNRISYSIIKYSGVSIKLIDSKNYQILKLTPNSFKSFFNVFELGVGASLFCRRDSELSKNKALIEGWFSSIKKMEDYFSEIINGESYFYLNKEICKKIKLHSQQEIENLIYSSKDLQQKIFNGVSLYEEPYTAYYLYHNNILEILSYIPHYITTGSGRSKGNYTLVLKPK